MNIVCLDLEGVLVPEIWISVSSATGIKELELTTRDVPDYDELMRYRLQILDKHDIRLPEIQIVIGGMTPLKGARIFLNRLREMTEVIILSDTYEQFARPLMKKLGWPTLFCNTLEVDESGRITGYRLRIPEGKKRSVEALDRLGYRVIAAGDSYNDLQMIDAAHFGVLFRPPDKIAAERPDLGRVRSHKALMTALIEGMKG